MLNTMTPFNGNFIASDGTIRNIDEIFTAISNAVSGGGSGDPTALYITGAQVGDEPPQDKSKLWLKPIN